MGCSHDKHAKWLLVDDFVHKISGLKRYQWTKPKFVIFQSFEAI